MRHGLKAIKKLSLLRNVTLASIKLVPIAVSFCLGQEQSSVKLAVHAGVHFAGTVHEDQWSLCSVPDKAAAVPGN